MAKSERRVPRTVGILIFDEVEVLDIRGPFEQYPAVDMRDNLRVVDTGHVVTSAGVSAGIDMAPHVVARLHDDETAAWTARRMEYYGERVEVEQDGR